MTPVATRVFSLAAVMLAAFLSGCASGPKTYQIRGEADPVVNRDASGAPLSVVVRLYQLKAAGEFSKLTFDTLASGRPEADLLGTDLLDKTEVVLVPGASYTATEALREDTRYVGVVAFFRRPHPHYWRYLVEADQVRREGLNFRAKDCYLTLVNVKPAPIPGQPLDLKPECEPLAVAQPAPPKPETATAEPARPAPTPAKKRAVKRAPGAVQKPASATGALSSSPVVIRVQTQPTTR